MTLSTNPASLPALTLESLRYVQRRVCVPEARANDRCAHPTLPLMDPACLTPLTQNSRKSQPGSEDTDQKKLSVPGPWTVACMEEVCVSPMSPLVA